MSANALRDALSAVRLVALDVDGTLTDGRIAVGDAGELAAFDVRDGIALGWLRERGLRVAWITGRSAPLVRRRAEALAIDELVQGARDKGAALRALQRRFNVPVAATAAMGDDLPDLAMLPLAVLFACPSDAAPEVRQRAAFVARAPGGRGAVRELAEAILRAQGVFDGLIEQYLDQGRA